MTIPQALQLAVQHHQAGQPAKAEALCRQILAVAPQHADALHLLGLIAHQVGRNDAALELLAQASVLAPNNPSIHANLGEVYRKLGRLEQAIAENRQALQLDPRCAEVHSNLGCALADQGRLDEAIAAYRQAVELRSDYSGAHYNLGDALARRGHTDEAIVSYLRALELRPDFAEAHNSLGNALSEKGRFDEAMAAYRRALELRPDYVEAHGNLGSVFANQGRLEDAIAAYRRALELRPDFVVGHNNLGNALGKLGRLDEAIASYRRALEFQPDFVEAHNNLGNALAQQGWLDEAIASFRRALALRPDFAQGLTNLGNALSQRGALEEAITALRRAVELNPVFANAHSNLGGALKEQGEVAEAITAFRTALRLDPKDAEAHSNLLLILHYRPGLPAGEMFQEHSQWGEIHARPLASEIEPHANDSDPDRRLRIGYVSPDFRRHSVAYFLENLLASHDRAQVEISCYADLRCADSVTARFREQAAHWRDITGMTDAQAAEVIRRDQIDILVDLAGHTAGSRLLLFARRPAPVQVTYLGYCDTTGMQAMDYRLTDAQADPPGVTEHLHTEQLIRLPEGAWCFRPADDAPPVSDLPALHTGGVTFGCFNALPKITEEVLGLWSRILLEVPGSRLLLKNLGLQDRVVQQRVRAIFDKAGVAADRVEMLGRTTTLADHLSCYGRVDIALDTFPYHGTTTTCEALWMGVPVITLAGTTHASRVGVSLLSNVGLPELIADSPTEYVEIAAALAADLPRLAAQRAGLRQRLAASPLLDGPRFARHVEAAYRQMWRTWCSHQPVLPPT